MTTDVTVVPAVTAMAPRGALALAEMTEADFQVRLEMLKRGQERIRVIQKELMVPEEDYGTIPGTAKPTLLKPGAEKLCAFYGLVPTYTETWIEGDGVTTPNLRVHIQCHLRRGGEEDGALASVGVGAASTWETKHRYRNSKRSCPACGTEGSIRKSKYPDKASGDVGWWCREESCKANFHSSDPTIVGQVAGTVENPDPYDAENTIYKMAKKRAYIDATLNATATSGLFAQDLEDMGAPDHAPAPGAASTAVASTTSEHKADELRQAELERATYERAGVEPPASRTSGGGRDGVPACPKGHPPAKVMRSKRGAGFFCHGCQAGFLA